jgi:hypothetical protein
MAPWFRHAPLAGRPPQESLGIKIVLCHIIFVIRRDLGCAVDVACLICESQRGSVIGCRLCHQINKQLYESPCRRRVVAVQNAYCRDLQHVLQNQVAEQRYLSLALSMPQTTHMERQNVSPRGYSIATATALAQARRRC